MKQLDVGEKRIHRRSKIKKKVVRKGKGGGRVSPTCEGGRKGKKTYGRLDTLCASLDPTLNPPTKKYLRSIEGSDA